MKSRLKALANSVTAALPAFITNPSKSRRVRNFRVDKIRELLGDERKAGIDAWLPVLRRLMRKAGGFGLVRGKTYRARRTVRSKSGSPHGCGHHQGGLCTTLTAAHDLFVAALKNTIRSKRR